MHGRATFLKYLHSALETRRQHSAPHGLYNIRCNVSIRDLDRLRAIKRLQGNCCECYMPRHFRESEQTWLSTCEVVSADFTLEISESFTKLGQIDSPPPHPRSNSGPLCMTQLLTRPCVTEEYTISPGCQAPACRGRLRGYRWALGWQVRSR